jgi:ribonuclease R
MAKKKKQPKRYLFEEILAFLQHNSGKTFNYKQIGAAMELNTEGERLELMESLHTLVDKGLIKEVETGKFEFKETKTYLTGTIDFTQQGTAFVTVVDEADDIFIPFKKTRDALQGDLVKIHLLGKRTGKRKEAEVVEVIKRTKTDFVGTIKILPKFAFVVPDGNKIHVDFFVRKDRIGDAEDGQKVLVRYKEWKAGDQNPTGEIVSVFGNPGEHKTEMNAIMAEYGLPEHFPDEIEAAAKKIPTEITDKEIANRRDFRKITTMTIDPADAKDFDDALSLQKLENGLWEVGVHIADVSHYIKPGSPLDKEAVDRATSVYLVDRCIPMLPEVLSNFACSLRPKEEKYCFSAVFQLDDDAKIHDQWFGKTVIYSDKRFAYEDVQKIIETEEGEYKDDILVLDKLAKKLRAERLRKGSIVFDKAEVKFHLDEEGNPIGVFFKTQQDAHKLIEDFMLLANRKVAEFLSTPDGQKTPNPKNKKDAPVCVYRIHDTPNDEKMTEFSNFVARFGYQLNVGDKTKTAQSINKLLVDVKNKKEQGMIELLAVRSMPKAIYTTKNAGHYGLGFDFYTHFTSPIRRYPDVMVHRLLEARLNGTKYSDREELELLCKHSSEMERVAAEAERASIKYKQVEYMSDKIGQIFKGTISGVTEWGIFVEITENKCEGLVRAREMNDDVYMFDEENYRYVGRHKGKIYALGDSVFVIVKKADLLKKQLDFGFMDSLNSDSNVEVASERMPGSRKKNNQSGGFHSQNKNNPQQRDRGKKKKKRNR